VSEYEKGEGERMKIFKKHMGCTTAKCELCREPVAGQEVKRFLVKSGSWAYWHYPHCWYEFVRIVKKHEG